MACRSNAGPPGAGTTEASRAGVAPILSDTSVASSSMTVSQGGRDSLVHHEDGATDRNRGLSPPGEALSSPSMDFFRIHERLLEDYRAFTSGYVEVRDARLRAHVQEQLDGGAQWPDPWLSLNPSFEPAGTVEDVVSAGVLH